jgi:hypothetical protein
VGSIKATNMAESTGSDFIEPFNEMFEAFEDIRGNLLFILKEIKTFRGMAEAQRSIREKCQEMHDGPFYDVRREFGELNEKLHPERCPPEPGRNPDPHVTLGFIINLTRGELANFDPLMERVSRQAHGSEGGTLMILLLESGTNMWNAWNRMYDAAEQIGDLWERRADALLLLKHGEDRAWPQESGKFRRFFQRPVSSGHSGQGSQPSNNHADVMSTVTTGQRPLQLIAVVPRSKCGLQRRRNSMRSHRSLARTSPHSAG